ncbi:CDP-diacylglycerol--glycerol-3-phosphate 3-phosphatidyltransferase [hydrothermal vent metagenome]|uniref:CDP-diacylglycerol--glycerol-3-phosphate 3-phosphatidyltransferase n=1 Tax=hydrothermal vent metagenome TaxID=652676 RepID=A0A3B1AHM6_9ZZZZ
MKMQARDIPNLISILRMLITIPVVWMLLLEQYGIALVLFAVAGFSDGLDGFLAKSYGWESRMGGILDPLADKILLVSCFFALGWLELVPYWLVVVVFFRDLLIAAGCTAYHFQVSRLDAVPSLASKLNTLVQIMLVLLVVLDQVFAVLPSGLLVGLIWITFTTTIFSGVGYAWVWSRRVAINSAI